VVVTRWRTMPLSTTRLFLSRAAAAASLAAMLAACSGGGSTSLPATAGADSAGGTLSTRSIAAATQGIGTLNAVSPFWKHQCQSDRKRCIMHVLLISIDGMHGVDLQRFVSAHPYSAVGKLARTLRGWCRRRGDRCEEGKRSHRPGGRPPRAVRQPRPRRRLILCGTADSLQFVCVSGPCIPPLSPRPWAVNCRQPVS